jgi:hypothetical protein
MEQHCRAIVNDKDYYYVIVVAFVSYTGIFIQPLLGYFYNQKFNNCIIVVITTPRLRFFHLRKQWNLLVKH